MKKKNVPDTSKKAYKQADELIPQHHKKIIAALRKIEKGNYEKIAEASGLDRHAVGRRLSELEGKQLVFRVGSKSKTKAGRDAYDYELTSEGMNVDVSDVAPAPAPKPQKKAPAKKTNDLIFQFQERLF